MIFKAELKAASGEYEAFVFEADGSAVHERLSFEKCSVSVDIIPVSRDISTEIGIGGVYAISIRPDSNIALSCFRLLYDMRVLAADGDAVYYRAAACTNDFVHIDRYDPQETDPSGFSRDLFMAQGSGSRINIAFSTFRRFFTRFLFSDKHIAVEQALEDKIMKAGTEYQLEHVMIDNRNSAGRFFEKYTVYLSKTHDIPEFKYIPRGWSSWSCYYPHIDEEKILKEAAEMQKELLPAGGDLLQLDDGWQKEGSFGAYWTADTGRFPNGMEGLQKQLAEMGIHFGIWMAPGLVKSTSTRFPELYDLLVKEHDGSIVKCFDGGEIAGEPIGVFALDLGKKETLAHTEEMFRRGTWLFGCDYFKIDFITNLLFRAGNGGMPVIYDSDYAVALYRRWIEQIRRTTGDDVFLLACGAPVGESIGVFDGIRVSPDITWGGAGKNGNPTPFELITKNAQNIFLRSPYHRRVFINDPDALLARDYFTEYTDDGLCLTDDEAVLWATVISNSGGHILLNEEIERLPEERLERIKRIIKEPQPAAARAKNFFEFPLCTETYIPFENDSVAEEVFLTGRLLGENGCVLCTVYNWGEETVRRKVDAAAYYSPDALEAYIFRATDRWDESTFIDFCGSFEIELRQHACRSFYIKPFQHKI